MDPKMMALSEKLSDERGKRVVFVSHCILNENTIYLGGAFRKGAVDELVDRFRQKGLGIVQMPCPEQKAWGGVLKRTMWLALGPKKRPGLMTLSLPLFVWFTGRVYRKMAKEVAREVKDYVDSGFEVAGIIGIRGSPSCGVRTTLDLKRSAGYLANRSTDGLSREELNERGIRACWISGDGMFIRALRHELGKRSLDIAFFEHDHFTER